MDPFVAQYEGRIKKCCMAILWIFLHDRQAEAKFEALESTAKSEGFVIVLGKKNYIWKKNN